MQKIYSENDLRAAILELEIRQHEEAKLLKEQFRLAYESVKPLNLIRSTLTDAVTSKDLKDNLVNTSVGLTAGYLSKAVFEGVTSSPLKKIFGTVLMFGIKNIVAKNPEAVKSVGRFFFKHILRKKEHIPPS
jgi:hypothetical protein